MIEHVTHLLVAYHDDELHGKRLRQVEEHLGTCESCQDELDQLQALSNLLSLHPAPSDLTTSDRFVAQVSLRMPRRPDEPRIKRAFNIGWRAAPLGILGIWAFVQSLLIVSGVVFLLMRMGINLGPILSLPSEGSGLGMFFGLEVDSIGEFGRTAFDVLGNGGPLGWGPTLSIALMLCLGLLYCSWMASWWIRYQEQTARGNSK
jgi:hypothetical protein